MSSNLELEIGNIATDAKKLLKGFKVLGVFPFYLNLVKTRVQIKLCMISSKIIEIQGDKEPTIEDFNNHEKMSKLLPLIEDYIITGLLNNRSFGFIIKPFLLHKLKQCSHYHLLNLYATIRSLNNESFFLSYFKIMYQSKSMILKEEKQS